MKTPIILLIVIASCYFLGRHFFEDNISSIYHGLGVSFPRSGLRHMVSEEGGVLVFRSQNDNFPIPIEALKCTINHKGIEKNLNLSENVINGKKSIVSDKITEKGLISIEVNNDLRGSAALIKEQQGIISIYYIIRH